MAKYEVLERSFINGRLCEKGAVVELEVDSPGTNLKPIGVAQVVKSAVVATGGQGGTTPAYTAKHNGGGRHIVIDASGKKVGDFVGANKEEAQAEADRLIAGGAPYVKPADSGTGGQGGTLAGEGAAGDEEDDPGLPDA